MFFNIQFSKAKFERLVLQYAQKRVLANENLGLGGIRIIPFDPLDFDARPEEGVIDRINLDQVELEYARGADAPRDDKVVNLPPLLLSGGREFPISSTIDIAVLQALCTISIYVVRKSDLIEAGIEGVHESKFVQFRIQVVFKVNQPQLNSNFLLLQFSPTGIRFGLGGLFADMEDIDNPVLRELGEELLEIMQENSEEWFPVVRFPVSDLEEALGGLQFWNAGIRMGSNVVDIQLQVDASDLNSTFRAGMNSFNQWETDWTDYYSNTLMDKTGSLDWGIFFPVDLFDQRIKDTVTTALAPRTDVILTRAPESNWEVSNVVRGEVGCFPGESGLLRTSIAVQLPGACIPWGYDMDVNISLNTSILIDEPGKIRLELRFSHEVDPGDVFVCGSLNAFLISSAGVVIGGAFGGWVGAVVGGVIGGLLGGFGTLGVILSQPIPSLSSPMLTRIEGEDNAYFAEIEIEPITNSILGEVAITSVTPCHNGIFAGGLLRENPGIAERLPAGNLVFPRWRQPGRSSCPEDGAAPHIVAELGYGFYRSAHPANIPLVEWNVEILNATPDSGWGDPLITRTADTLVYRYHFERFEVNALRLDAGSSNPSLQILFQTNFGARIFTLSMPERLNDAAYSELLNEINERCNANQDLINMFEDRIGHLRDILNGPRFIPGRDLIDAIWWTINFIDFDKRSAIALQTKMSNKLVTLDALKLSNSGSGRLDFWQSEKGFEQELFLATKGLDQPKHGKDPRFMVGMKAFQKRGNIALKGAYLDHKLIKNHQGTLLMVLMKGRVSVYSLDETKVFSEVFRRDTSDIKKIVGRGGNLWMVNANGGVFRSSDGKHWDVVDQKSQNPSNFSYYQASLPDNKGDISSREAVILSQDKKVLFYMEQVYTDLGTAKPSQKKPVDPIKIKKPTVKDWGFVKGMNIKIPKPKS